ncbi:MAG: type I restriction-modification system subunit M [Cetobacterium sp.]|uniref:type I restriction-modification system subunit M n=1 Tax=Cetobacterium sp. TaxID=2071632 RepID=UPI003F3E5B1E
MDINSQNPNYVGFLWNIAESLRGTYKAEDYGKVMLPLIVLRRFDCLLDEYDREIIKKIYKETDYVSGLERDIMVIAELEEVHKMKNISFFNISDYDFKSLLDDSENIAENLKNYINGFSENVKNIMKNFKFSSQIDHLNKKNKLYSIIQKFAEVDFHIDKIPNERMGQIYEELIRRFYENTDAGEHYTPREVVELCMEMLFYTKEEFIKENGKYIDIADFCAGTGGMLSEARRYIESKNKNAEIQLYGQELMDESFAICQADMIMKGENPENIRLGNTLSEDRFKGEKFRFLISNPPYGVTWKDEEHIIKMESELGFDGRFGAGTPRTTDGSLLFLQNMISKMKDDNDGSRIAIILNGSPLFTGDAGSGESNIRKWIIESDLLEGIIALPTDMFYNTGISTYIWVLTNKKISKRKGKIQLIDATKFYDPMKKSLGSKRKELSTSHIKDIKDIYSKFEESDVSKIFDNKDFGFVKVTIERPLRLKFQITDEVIENIKKASFYKKLNKDQQEQLNSVVNLFDKIKVYMSRNEFLEDLNSKIKLKNINFIKTSQIKNLISIIGVQDNEAEICRDSKGNIEADSSLRDYEFIPLKENIKEYFKREVCSHIEDAWIDEGTLDKVGYEIPFTKYFYKHEELRSFTDIISEIEELEKIITSEIYNIFN